MSPHLAHRRFAPLLLIFGALALARSSGPWAADAAASTPSHAAARVVSEVGQCPDASAFDLERLLPPPPAEGSAEEQHELAEILAVQSQRTPAQSGRARADARISIYRFADALGNPPAFNPQRLPVTTAFFRQFRADESGVVDEAKRHYARRRPFVVDPRVHPIDPEPNTASYPSGHATWAAAAGLVLADMIPEHRAAILARADEFAHNRVVGGVHFPSDIRAGELAGTAIAALLFACPRFDQAEAAAKAELRTALGLGPAPPH